MNRAMLPEMKVVSPAEMTARDQTPARETVGGVRRVIFLLGTSRSGTTWLAYILNSYPQVLYSHEPFSRLRSPQIDAIVQRIKETGSVDQEGRDAILQRWSTADYDCQRPPFFKKSFLTYPPWLRMAGWIFVRATGRGTRMFRRLYSQRANHAFDVLVKEINWSDHARAIVFALNPMLVNIVRHPCGVVASILRGHRLGLLPVERNLSFANRCAWFGNHEQLCKRLGYSRDAIQALEDCEFHALDWLGQNLDYLAVAEAHPPSHLVVYEDLCRNPLKVAQGVYEFLGWELGRSTSKFLKRSTQKKGIRTIDWLQAKHAYFGVLKNSSHAADAWKDQLTDRQKHQILSIARVLPRFEEFWPDRSDHA